MQYSILTRQTQTKKAKSWQVIVSYKDKNGKWLQRTKSSFSTKREAKDYGDKIVEELKETASLNVEYEGITFGEFSKEFLESAEVRMEPNTIKNLKMVIKKFDSLNDIELNKITKMDMQRIIDDFVKQGLKTSSVRQYKRYISTLFTAAMDYELINKDPSKGLKIAQTKHEETQKALTDAELEELLDAYRDTKYYNLLYLLTKTGLRIGEACGLTYEDFDLVNCEITISKQWKGVAKGRGRHDFGTLKSKNSYRTVPISQKTAKIFKEMFDITDSKTGRIFDYNTDHALTNINRTFKKKGFDISLHTLRHTYITKLLFNGVDPKTCSEIAGHSLEMTMKIYSHVNADMRLRAKNIINSIL